MQRWGAELGLLLVVVIWGSSFLIVHEVTQGMPVLGLIALRFWVAALAVSWFARRGLAALTRRGLWAGVKIGLFLFAGFWTQTEGIARTSPARAGFLTGLSVVLVPVLVRLLWKERQPRAIWAGVGLALAGLGLLGLGGPSGAGGSWLGDALVIACAFAYAGHLLAIDKLGGAGDVLALTAVQLWTVALLSTLAGLGMDGFSWPGAAGWGAIVYLGTLSTALAYGVQMWAQRRTSPARAALLFSTEPVFAALFSWGLGGEQLSGWLLGGGALLLAGVLCAELGREPRPR